jgi:hypothetical protein
MNMADAVVLHLLMDTSYVRSVSFSDPDFRRLLQFSKDGVIRILVPHIVWEERRTQLVDAILVKVRKLRVEIEELKAPWMGGLVADGPVYPTTSLWPDSEIVARSKEVMAAIAEESKIKIVPIGADHADRAWTRYFDADLPFDRVQQDRSLRRKDIPDSWIFEAAIDLIKEHGKLSAVCRDGRLSGALTSLGITVLGETQDALDAVSAALSRSAAQRTESTAPELTPAERPGVAGGDEVDSVLARANEGLQELQKKILGYVGFLNNPSKGELVDLLSSVGYPVDTVQNAAERLVLNGLIEDTGNHYIPRNREVCALAAPLVESEIIKLLENK